MSRTTMVLGAALVAAVAIAARSDAASGAKAPAGAGAKAYGVIDAGALQFKEAGVEGVQTAQLWGDMSKDGDWGAVFRFKAGTDVGWHTHSGRVHLVMISGTMNITPEGGAPTDLAAGAFADDPGKVKHRSMCKEGADCLFLIHMTKKFDFLKADEPTAARK